MTATTTITESFKVRGRNLGFLLKVWSHFVSSHDPEAGIQPFRYSSLASTCMSVSSINCFVLNTHPRIQMSVVLSPLLREVILQHSCKIKSVKWSWSSSVAAILLHLSQDSWEKLDWQHQRGGGWRISFSSASFSYLWSQLSFGIRDLLELEKSLLHIYTNVVCILKSFNVFIYFSSKTSKCFLPLGAVFGSSVLSGNHLTAWSKVGICCNKENVMLLCSSSHMQTPFACA